MADTEPQKINLRDIIKTEYTKCALDPAYFIRRYCYIQTQDEGKVLFGLYKYQENTLKEFLTHDYTIVLKARQIGISTLTACYSLWIMLFHGDKNILVIATKQETAKNMITKVRYAFENLPVWLQVPYEENNKLSLRFKNGSQIKAAASSADAGRSESCYLLIVDEAAHIANIKEIWTSAQATLANGGRAILISTPLGVGNFFHQKWIDAEENVDKNIPGIFYPIKLDWRVHPNRDNAWREREGILQGEQKARQEYDAEFIGSGNTVYDANLIEWYATQVNTPSQKISFGGHEVWIWQNVNYTKSYVVVADVARGDGMDCSAFHVLDAKECVQVAEYRGQCDTTEYANMLVAIATMYNDALLVVENANVGWAVIQHVINREYKNLFYMSDDLRYVDPETQIENRLWKQQKKSVPGFTTSARTRPLIISKLDEFLRTKEVKINSLRLIEELRVFIWDKGKAQAMDGYNDDLVMSMAIGLWVRETSMKLFERNIELTRMTLDKFQRTGTSDIEPVYMPGRVNNNPYIVPLGRDQVDMREWL